MSFSAGSILSDLGLNIDPFTKGMVQAQGISQLFPSVVTNFLASPLLGWVSLAKTAADGVGNAVQSAFEYVKSAFFEVSESAHNLGVEAEKAGVSAGFLGKVGAAAKEVNLPMEEVAHSMAFLSRNAADAAEGNEATAMSFAKLGISVYDSTGHVKDTEGLFREVADAISGLDSPAKQAAAAMDLLSRGGLEMLPLLKHGSAGVDEASGRIRAASGGMATDLIGISDKVVQMEHVWDASWTGIKRSVATPFLRFAAAHAQDFETLMNRVAGGVRTAIGYAFSWIEGHSGPVAAALTIAAGYAARGLRVAWDAVQRGIEYVKGTAIPAIQDGFARAMVFLQPVTQKFGEIFRSVWQDVQPIIAWFRGPAADAIGNILPQAFAAAKPYVAQARDILVVWLDAGKQVSHWVLTEAVPAIGGFLTEAFATLQPAIEKVGPAMHAFLDFAKESYTLAAHYLTPALEKFGEIAKPVVGVWLIELKAFGQVLGWIFDKVTALFSYLGDKLHLVNQFNQAAAATPSITRPPPPPAPSGVAVGLQASGGLQAGVSLLGNQFNQFNPPAPRPRQPAPITVDAHFGAIDTHKATSEIAAALRPAIQQAAQQQRQQLNRAADAGAVGGAL